MREPDRAYHRQPMREKKKIIFFIGIGLMLFSAAAMRLRQPMPRREITFGGRQMRVWVAETSRARQQGLSGQRTLGEDEGMVFLFPTPARHRFWMYDMHFAIDILWIRKGYVVDIAHDVLPPPDSVAVKDLPLYTPRLPADVVLEVRAGTAAKEDVRIGDMVGGLL